MQTYILEFLVAENLKPKYKSEHMQRENTGSFVLQVQSIKGTKEGHMIQRKCTQ